METMRAKALFDSDSSVFHLEFSTTSRGVFGTGKGVDLELAF